MPMTLKVADTLVSGHARFYLSTPAPVTADNGAEFKAAMIRLQFDTDGKVYVDGEDEDTGRDRRLDRASARAVLDALGFPTNPDSPRVYLAHKLRLFA